MLPLEYEVWNPWPAVYAFAIFVGLVVSTVVFVHLMYPLDHQHPRVSSFEGEILSPLFFPEHDATQQDDLFHNIEEYRNDFPEAAVVNIEDARGQLPADPDRAGFRWSGDDGVSGRNRHNQGCSDL